MPTAIHHLARPALLALAASVLTAPAAFAQTTPQPAAHSSSQTANPAGPAQAIPPPPPFRGRSWGDYWNTVTTNRRELSALRHYTDAFGVHHDAGSLGNQTTAPYFSGPDTSLGVDPYGYSLWAGAQLQSDCSLSETIIGYNTTTSQFELKQTIPGFEKFIHSISGLSASTVDKFPNGCAYPNIYGQLYRTIAAGKLASGNYVGATFFHEMNNQVVTGVYTPAFVNQSTNHYTVGYGVAGILAADFNGDGAEDIAAIYADYGNGSEITILLANGDGTYKTPVNLTSDVSTFGLVAGDFNGDKKIDLVATSQKANGDYELLFFAGNGDGTFQPYTSVDTGTTERLVSLPVDINKDGKLDIMAWDFAPATYPVTYTLDALINNGSASFTPTLSYSNPTGFYPVATGDLNGDGKLDLVYTDIVANSVTVLEGSGAGSFTFKSTYPTIYYPDSAYIADYDGDGHADILVGVGTQAGVAPTQNGGGEILLGNGDFTFSAPPALQPLTAGVTHATGPQSFAVADLNGDAKQDVAIYGHTSATAPTVAVSTYLNNGTAVLTSGSTVNFTLAPAISYDSLDNGTLLAIPLSGTSPNSLVAAGLDPNTQQGAIQSAVNNGSGTFSVKSTLLELPAPVAFFSSADFNADSKADLALILNDGTGGASDGLYIARGNGDGTFQTPTLLDSAVSRGGYVTTADINGDGKPDLLVAQTTGGYSYIRVYLNQGSTFASPVTFSTPDGATVSWIIPTDFNGDGKLDLILIGSLGAGYPSNLYLYTGNKTATFTYANTIALGYVYANSGIVADVNQDGIPDLVLDGCCLEGAASVMIGKGGGAYQPPNPLFPINAYGVQAINLNGDSYPDLIFGIDDSSNGVTAGAVAPLINHYANAPTVGQSATVTTLTNPPSGGVVQGEDLQLRITVAETSTPEIPTGTVTLLYGSTVITSGLLDNSGGVYLNLDSTPFPAGSSYPFTISYAGDVFNKPSTTTFTVKVIYATALSLAISPNPVPYQDSVTLSSTVTRSPGSGNATGYVSFFYNNGNTPILTNQKLVNGSVSVTESTKGLPAGIYDVVAYYFGDANDGDSNSVTIPVTLVPKGLDGSVTAVSLSPNPITQGQTATISAAVTKTSGSGTPTGTVNFTANGVELAKVPLNSSGVAKITADTNYYYADSYQITASYSGDSTTFKSQSPVFNFILRYPTTTALQISPTTITPGQAVTLSAIISYYTFTAPTGRVKFYADGFALGSASINGSGVAALTANSTGIPAGAYKVTAVYSGDTYNGASTSSPVSVTVQ